jgi:ribonuclease VapC
MFVDASAIVAIMVGEADGPALMTALESAPAGTLVTSPVAIWEATAGLFRRKSMPIAAAEERIQRFLSAAGIRIEANEANHVSDALQAFDRYGRHRYPEQERNRALNLADCFHYASAKSRGVAILTKDVGFSLTDLRVVALPDAST